MSRKKASKRKHSAKVRVRKAKKRNCRAAERRRASRRGSPVAGPFSSGLGKMSDTILAFATPLLEGPLTEQDMRDAIGLAVIAWNVSFLPDASWREALDAIDHPPSDEPDRVEELVVEMASLRQLVFADDNRFIVDFQLSFERDEPHLEVAWTRVERPAAPNRQHHASPADHWLEQLELDLV